VRVLSVCRYLPDPGSPAAGGFVFERLAAMAALTPVTILQPVPYFPLLRGLPRWAREPGHEHAGRRIEHAPMLYLPGLLKSLDATWLERSVRRALPRLGGAKAFEVVDAHFGYPDGVGCVRLARRCSLPAFVTVRGLETDVVEDPATGPQLVRALNDAKGVISVSHSLRDLLVGRGVDARQFRVIPNAVDRQRFRPGDRRQARARLGLSSDVPLIVAVGNLIELKRHHVLIEAFARLRANRPTAELAIVGGGEAEPSYEARLRALSRSAGLGSAVRFVGRIAPAEVASWLDAADVFALATSREGCCNSILEALASGRPVVTTPAGDNAHFVRDGVNGYIVAIDDAEATASALGRALSRSNWDSEAISQGLEVGGWQDVAGQVLAYFRERVAA
jgi:glycosyltransferase involved in cell wall biosynthesis